MPLTEDDYEPLTEDEIIDILETELRLRFGSDIDLTENSVFGAIAQTVAAVTAENQEQSLEDVYNAAFLSTAEGENLDRVVELLGIERREAQQATGVVTFSSTTPVTADRTIPSGTLVQTEGSDPVLFETVTSGTITSGNSSVNITVEALEGGSQGNLGGGTLTVLPSPPPFVDSATNSNPTGDPQYNEVDGSPQRVGRDEETDNALRERARDTVTTGGDATADALTSAVLNADEDVRSVTIFENNTAVDNTGTGGLPPHSFELVVLGGDSQTIADAIFDTKAVTARDYSGANGTSVSETVQADNGQSFNIEFSRPNVTDIDMTLDLVVDSTYEGNNAVRDAIVDYIGGTLSDGETVTGLGVNEDVYIDRIENLATDSDLGVIGLNKAGTSYTPSTNVTAEGLDFIPIGATDVSQTDATDGSITINTTTI